MLRRRVISSSERWIQGLERILERIDELERAEDKDRLDHVRSIRFGLGAIYRSLNGWIRWINNPEVMSRFTKEELEEMDKELSKFARSFLEYDMDVTKKGAEKGLEAKRRVEGRGREEGFYI